MSVFKRYLIYEDKHVYAKIMFVTHFVQKQLQNSKGKLLDLCGNRNIFKQTKIKIYLNVIKNIF